MSAGGSASGGGSGSAQVDGGCYNGTTKAKVADWHAELSFTVAVTGQSDGQGHLNLGVSKTAGKLDSLVYSTEAPPQVADCRAQANASYQTFINGLLGSVTIDARSGATGRIGSADPGTVTITR